MSIEFSEIESKRFNRTIYRGNLPTLDIAVLKSFYKNNDPDTLIIRVPATEQANLHLLNELGKDIIFADTLVYHTISLQDFIPKPIKNDLAFKITTQADTELLKSMIPGIFKNYTNHYSSNPLLDKKNIIEGYTEWTLDYIDNDNKFSFIVYKDDEVAAFITCSIVDKEGEDVLGGILPEYSGSGIYTDMIRYTQSYFKENNCQYMKVSTQVNNYAVQKTWIREGFNFSHALLTLHLNKR